jgi:subtilisin family serine protease
MDDNGHGTHVSGTIGAVGNNYQGVVGANWRAQIIGLKFITSNGSGSTSDAIKAIEFAIQVKAFFASTATPVNVRVLSNSWGGSGLSQSLLNEINKANDNEMLFVVAAGNAANDACGFTPARTPSAITVGAMDPATDLRWLGSNYGACVDIWAPGLFIDSDYIGSDTAVANLSGTSMASPFVVGVAALYLETHRKALPAEVVNTITTNATPNMLPDAGAGSPNLVLYSNF